MKKNQNAMLCHIGLLSICFFSSDAIFAQMPSSKEGKTHPGISCFSSLPGDVNIFADLLVWTAKEAGADCWAEVITTQQNASFNDLREVHFGWDPGFRVGLDYRMKHDLWDTKLFYTWFYTKGTDRVQSIPGSVHSSFMANFWLDNSSGSGISGPSYQAAKVDWSIHYNMFDWELGRRFSLSKSLAIRPLIGIKGGWIHQDIDSSWMNPNIPSVSFPSATYFYRGKEKLTNYFWGIGPVLGADTEWKLYSSISHTLKLLGDLSGSIMWGHWSFSDRYHNDIGQNTRVNLASQNSGATMVRCLMGLGWDVCCRDHSSIFSMKAGYEMQFWMDQLQYYSFVGGRLVNELTLQGGTLELSFSF